LSEVKVKHLTKSVKIAIYDRDLKAREYKKYPVSKDGSKISVRSGGKRNFNPTFDNDSYIELPYRSPFSFWKISWDRIYFARNGAKACVRFRKAPNSLSRKIQTIADLEELIKATSGEHPNPEALFQLNEVLNILHTAGEEDSLNPDPEQVMEAAENQILQNIGKEKVETPTLMYVLIGLQVFTVMRLLGMI